MGLGVVTGAARLHAAGALLGRAGLHALTTPAAPLPLLCCLQRALGISREQCGLLLPHYLQFRARQQELGAEWAAAMARLLEVQQASGAVLNCISVPGPALHSLLAMPSPKSPHATPEAASHNPRPSPFARCRRSCSRSTPWAPAA